MGNANELFEMKAGAFRAATGMLAPGKDAGTVNHGEDYEQRRHTAWKYFCDGWNAAKRLATDETRDGREG